MSVALFSGWAISSHSEYNQIQDALNVLSRSAQGRSLLGRAEAQWKTRSREEFVQKFRWGAVSRTDAVLTRHYHPETGKESREREVTVYLREGQSLEDLVLDIAHELTHATHEPSWDPYDPGLTAAKYLHAALEGSGGEVDALVAECQVGMDLLFQLGPSAGRCLRYREDGGARISREKVRQDFYRVGKWRSEVIRRLGEGAQRFPLLSSESPQLYSSTGGAPYPAALIKEFDQLNQSACDNTRKRLDNLVGRSLASQASAQRNQTLEFLRHRCR